MGLEARCVGHSEGESGEGRAHLETDALDFRGPFRRRLPLAEVTAAVAENGRLIVEHPAGPLALDLGAAAARWARRITHPPTLLDKLGLRPGSRGCLVRLPDDTLPPLLSAAGVVIADTLEPGCDWIVAGLASREDLPDLARLRAALQPAGALWVLRPRGSPNLTEADLRAAAKEHGLVDVKTARYSDTHTAEKLVIPLALRARRALA